MSQPLFSILIPTWNNLPYLQLCVESILKHSTYRHQLILHINEGTDGTLDWARNNDQIEFTQSSENIGICEALNLAATKATTDYICYFNDDMYALPAWDKVLLEQIEQLGHHQFFFSATMIEPFAGKNMCAIGGYNFGTNPANFNETELLSQFADIPKKDWCGASWPPNVVHKSLWDKVGGYSLEFSPGLYSDPDFSMKLWQVGVREFRGIANSRVYHFGSKSLKRIQMNDGRSTFKQKWKMTPGFFDKHYLHKGKEWSGTLPEAKKNLSYWVNRCRVKFIFF
ncbi:MAG: glycosyltransferase [Bacteroidia bacterium]|nr:glycosyltransferase family 2 protein [Bacteroidia bacterium]MCO5254127.1 glycosyltransferase [Bacteroidota bacterium]MCZ2129949.1 glycosyltransferase [Bacteroidia bacterium]